MTGARRMSDGKVILLCFIGFFSLIILVNVVFIYVATSSNTGVITENAYEKGLAYNKILSAAKNQPDLNTKAAYNNGKLTWAVTGPDGQPLTDGNASALMVRPIKDGNDFSLSLKETGPGIYEADADFPAQGLWEAKLEIKWDNNRYHTSQSLLIK